MIKNKREKTKFTLCELPPFFLSLLHLPSILCTTTFPLLYWPCFLSLCCCGYYAGKRNGKQILETRPQLTHRRDQYLPGWRIDRSFSRICFYFHSMIMQPPGVCIWMAQGAVNNFGLWTLENAVAWRRLNEFNTGQVSLSHLGYSCFYFKPVVVVTFAGIFQ